MKDDKFAQILELISIGTAYVPMTSESSDHLSSLSGKEIKEVDCCFCASNEPGIEFAQNLESGEVIYMEPVQARDLKFHKAYMAFLRYIWEYLPDNFHQAVPKNQFYKFLKHLKGDYDVRYRFKDENKREALKTWLKVYKKQFRITYKTIDKISEYCSKMEMVEYKSISFSKMDEDKFREYVRNQLPFIYDQVIGKFYEGDQYNDIIETIEKDWEKFLSKL